MSVKRGTLIVFSGLPASGKTTLSSKLAAYLGVAYIRVDAILLGIKESTKTPDLPIKCFRAARSLAFENLRLGNSVVSDSVNADFETRSEWDKVAEAAGAKVIHVEIICSNKEEHRQRLQKRNTTLPGLADPTWQEVLALAYHDWDRNRIQIDTSELSVESSFAQLLTELEIG